MDFEAAKKKVAEIQGEPVDRPIEKYQGFIFGERVAAIEDDDENGVASGDEGIIVIQEVGAPQHNNVRINIGVIFDRTDCPIDVDPNNLEELD